MMEYLGAPRPDVPMAEMTEIGGGGNGGGGGGGQTGPKSGANLGPPAAPQQRRSVTGYDATMDCKFKFYTLHSIILLYLQLLSKANLIGDEI